MSSPDTGSESSTPGLDIAAATTWPVAMFIGVITIVLGIVVLAWPSETLRVLAVLLGISLLLSGIFRVIAAFSEATTSPWFTGFIGIIGMMAGIIIIRNPFESVAVLATVLGVVWIVGGTIDLIASITDSSLSDRGLHAFGALISIAAGVVIVAWPAPTLMVIAVIAGIYLIAVGIMACVVAFRLRAIAN